MRTMQTFLDRAKNATQLDGFADRLDRLATRLPFRKWADRGQELLGHPAHPALTDLPIGFWTSSWVLDNLGGRKRAPASQFLLGLGILSAVPTAVIGLGDATYLEGSKRRVAVVHATANSVALGFATASFLVGRGQHRGHAVLLNWLAAGAATVGGYLGGVLALQSSDDADEPKGVASTAGTAKSGNGSTANDHAVPTDRVYEAR